MNPQEVKELVLDLLSEAMYNDAFVREEYEDVRCNSICRTPVVTVGIADGNQDEVKISITVYSPFQNRSSGCEALQEKVRLALDKDSIKYFQHLTEQGVGYTETMQAYYVKSTALFQTDTEEQWETIPVLFGDYSFLANADSLQLSCKRQMTAAFSPYIGDIMQDLGTRRRTLSGVTTGNADDYDSLYSLYLLGEIKTISVGSISFQGVLTSLITEKISGDCLDCKFTFMEVLL